ncbi:MAG: glycogen/starch synthase, partial [Proteobacteria bacterium]|nr:glycogen/starch synthase [Pseudomonadota bacterium]
YQGRYYAGLMNVLDIGWEHFNHLELEWQNQCNLLKGGLYHATLFNAVSHGYAAEIQTPQFGHGLEGVVPAVRRSHGRRERDRLLLDLWRQPALHALGNRRKRPRSCMGQQPLRRQCRIRSWYETRARPAAGSREKPRQETRCRPR